MKYFNFLIYQKLTNISIKNILNYYFFEDKINKFMKLNIVRF